MYRLNLILKAGESAKSRPSPPFATNSSRRFLRDPVIFADDVSGLMLKTSRNGIAQLRRGIHLPTVLTPRESGRVSSLEDLSSHEKRKLSMIAGNLFDEE